MNKLVSFFVRYTSLVLIATIGIIFLGINSYTGMPKESFPQIEIPYIIVTTIYKGVSPSDIETLVTKPIEKKIKSISGIKKVTATSAESVSSVVVQFNADVKVDTALQKVRDKVAIAKAELPNDADEPSITEINFNEIPIMIISLSGDFGLNRLKELADDLKDEIDTISGVLNCNIVGGLDREIDILVDPARLKGYNLSLDQYTQALALSNINMPGGSIDIGNTSYLVRVPADFKNVQEIRNTVLGSFNGRNIYVKDIADVEDTHKTITSKSRTNGKESVTLSIQKRSGANLIEVAEKIKKIVTRQQKYFPKGTEVQYTTDNSIETKDLVDDMENTLIMSVLLVVGILYLFMGFRNAAIVGTIIPLSLLITFIVIKAMDFRLNFMVLFALIMLLGMLVDAAVVVVENIYRMLNDGAKRSDAVINGTAEVLIPILTSTLTTVFAFLPLAFWPGMIGKIMRYMPITVCVGLMASFLIAGTINPVMSRYFLKKKNISDENIPFDKRPLVERVDTWFEKIKERYVKLLSWAQENTNKIFKYTAVAFVLSLVVIATVPKEFFPTLPPEEFYVDITMPAGTVLAQTDATVKLIENYLSKDKSIEQFVASVGNTGVSGLSFSGGTDKSNIARVSVKIVHRSKLKEPAAKVVDRARVFANTIPGAEIKILLQKMGPPSGEAISVKITGDNLDTLKKIGEEVKAIMRSVKGVVDIKDNMSAGKPEIQVEIDRDKAAYHGLNALTVAAEVRTAFNGSTATKFRTDNDEYDIVVKLSDANKNNDINKLRNFSILSRTGVHIPLSRIANITPKIGVNSIQREDYERVINITAATDRTILPFVALNKIQKKMAKEMKLPEGYKLQYTGENEEMKSAFSYLGSAFLTALLLILITLVAQFNSFFIPFIIMITIGLQFIGVALGLKITGSAFGLMAFIGEISLAGVVVNNGIVMLDFVLNRQNSGMDRKSALLDACKTRLRPVLLTAATTALGLLPLILGFSINFKKMSIDIGAPNLAYWKPMSSVIFFGLIASTVLTLIIVPAMYYRFDTYMETRRAKHLKRFEE